MSKTVFASHIKTDFSLSDSHHNNSLDPRPRIELGNRYESKHIIGKHFQLLSAFVLENSLRLHMAEQNDI